MSATVTYKGTTLTTAENETKTLKTAGKYLEGDVIITDVTQGGDPKGLIVRPDAELVHSWTMDELIVADHGATLPAYSTSAKNIVTGAALTPTISVDYTNYCYYITMRGLAIPQYNTTTKQKGRCDYGASTYLYELVQIPANTIKTVDGSKTYTSRSAAVQANGSVGREVYWTSATAITVANNVTYGAYVTAQAPTISGTTLTVKAPIYGIRGNTNQMTSGAWGTMTDIREMYTIEVWRAPRQALEGWQMTSNLRKTIDTAMNGGDL